MLTEYLLNVKLEIFAIRIKLEKCVIALYTDEALGSFLPQTQTIVNWNFTLSTQEIGSVFYLNTLHTTTTEKDYKY